MFICLSPGGHITEMSTMADRTVTSFSIEGRINEKWMRLCSSAAVPADWVPETSAQHRGLNNAAQGAEQSAAAGQGDGKAGWGKPDSRGWESPGCVHSSEEIAAARQNTYVKINIKRHCISFVGGPLPGDRPPSHSGWPP